MVALIYVESDATSKFLQNENRTELFSYIKRSSEKGLVVVLDGESKNVEKFQQDLNNEGLTSHIKSLTSTQDLKSLTSQLKQNAASSVTIVTFASQASSNVFAPSSDLDVTHIDVVTAQPVTGFFVADHKKVPRAFLLKTLTYNEAASLLTYSGHSLVPTFLSTSYLTSLSSSNSKTTITLRSTADIGASEYTTTAIVPDDQEHEKITLVKAVATRDNIVLVQVENSNLPVATFLSTVTEAFKAGNLSMDTSPFLVTASGANQFAFHFGQSTNATHLSTFVSHLTQSGLQVTVNGLSKDNSSVSTVTLVGEVVSGALHLLSSALKNFEQSGKLVGIHSTAKNDTSLTFVVDSSVANKFVSKIYESLFEERAIDTRIFGGNYADMAARFGKSADASSVTEKNNQTTPVRDTWWRKRSEDLINLANQKTPVFVLNESSLKDSLASLKSALSETINSIFYAIKANPNPAILRIFEEAGLGFECVSPGELDHIFSLFPTISPSRVLFTPNFAPKSEYAYGFSKGVNVTVDNLHPLLNWGEIFRDQKVFLRLDPGKGDGHHQFVRTAGKQSKFGISTVTLPQLAEKAKELNVHIVGLHAHLGSGILNPDAWLDTAIYLSKMAKTYFPEVTFLDLGGGLGVPYREEQQVLDLNLVNQSLVNFKKENPQFQLWMEPGRYLVAPAGVLLTRVNQLKNKEGVNYVGVDTGFNSLVRPVLYGSYHQIVNLSKVNEPMAITAEVCGNICESGDVFGHNRVLAATQEGDVILMATTGAYGSSMSSSYNMRNPAEEVVLQSK